MTRFCVYISAFIGTISFANQLPSQMYRTEAIAKVDPKPVCDLLDYMKKNATQDSPSFCMNYDHQYVNLSYDRASIHVSKAAILVVAFELARVGWNLMFNANPEYKDLPHAVKNQLRGYTQEDFRYYFETFFNKSTHLFTEFEHLAILRQYPLYQFIEFIRYIQILPHYCEYMILIAHQHNNQFTLRDLMPKLYTLEYHIPQFLSKEDLEHISREGIDCELVRETIKVSTLYDVFYELWRNAHRQRWLEKECPCLVRDYIDDIHYKYIQFKKALKRSMSPLSDYHYIDDEDYSRIRCAHISTNNIIILPTPGVPSAGTITGVQTQQKIDNQSTQFQQAHQLLAKWKVPARYWPQTQAYVNKIMVLPEEMIIIELAKKGQREPSEQRNTGNNDEEDDDDEEDKEAARVVVKESSPSSDQEKEEELNQTNKAIFEYFDKNPLPDGSLFKIHVDLRKEAWEEMQKNKIIDEQIFNLSDDAQQFADDYAIDIDLLTYHVGNQFDLAIQRQIIDLIEKTAQQRSIKSDFILGMVADAAQGSATCNKLSQPIPAFTLADAGCLVLDTSCGFFDGYAGAYIFTGICVASAFVPVIGPAIPYALALPMYYAILKSSWYVAKELAQMEALYETATTQAEIDKFYSQKQAEYKEVFDDCKEHITAYNAGYFAGQIVGGWHAQQFYNTLIENPSSTRFSRSTEKITNKEARQNAKKLGFVETKDFPFDAQNELVFKQGNEYITIDKTRHKGGYWKMFKKSVRQGTFTKDLKTKIGK